MTAFEASNGVSISRQPPVTDRGPWLMVDGHMTSPNDAQALREFFQYERDEELGRWRWPENPDYVVYPRGESGVHVLDESSGIGAARFIHRNGDPDNPTAEYKAAYAYFEAHPERKPWEAAKPGEVWLLTTRDEVNVPAVTSSSSSGRVVFTGATHDAGGTEEIALSSDYIISARRIRSEDAR